MFMWLSELAYVVDTISAGILQIKEGGFIK